MRKITGITAVVGLALVILSMASRFFEIIPARIRTITIIVGFVLMLLGTLWRVVHDMHQPDED